MTGEGVKKKRDPIFSVCFVVFILACVGVLGTFVDQHYLEEDDTVVAYGDTVNVDYTGTFYAPYGEDKAVVFDTSVKSIGNNDDIVKSNTFSRSSYSNFEVTVGSGSALTAFENALVGHKVGDTVKIVIRAGDGYNAPEETMHSDVSTTLTVPASYSISKTVFEDQNPDVDYTAGVPVSITSPYGWPATAIFDAASNSFTIYNLPEAGTTYDYSGNDDSDFGKATFAVTAVTDSTITCTIAFTDTVSVDDGIQMLELSLDGTTWFVTDVGNGTFSYKTCGETYNIDLYFEIKIVSIE